LHGNEVHDNDFDLRRFLLDQFYEVQTVLSLQAEIHENDLRFQLLCALQHCLFTVSKCSDDLDVRLLIEHCSQAFAQESVVFD